MINPTNSDKIANPMYNLTFKALFCPKGPIANFYGPKERLLSFIQEIFPQDKIAYIEYIEKCDRSRFKIISFDVECQCFDEKGNFVNNVHITRSEYIEAIITNYDEYIKDESYKSFLPKDRILSLLNKNINEKEQAIFNVNFISKNAQTDIDDNLTLAYIQLPKIIEEGINSSWLKILSAGATKSHLISIDKTQFIKDAHISALVLLEAYTKDEKYKELLKEKRAVFWETISENSIYEKAREEAKQESRTAFQIETNHDRVCSIINLIQNDDLSFERIAKIFDIPVEYVDFIVATACFYYDYCQSKAKGKKQFLKQLQNIITPPKIE